MRLTDLNSAAHHEKMDYTEVRVLAEDRQLGETIPPRNPHVGMTSCST